MKINIYYGGRGIVDDPTIFALEKIENVLRELNVEPVRYNLYDYKNNITTLANTLKETNAVILATTLEWYGIGGYMQQFLDVCWMYGDKDVIKNLYMFPVVMSTTYGEREARNTLMTAWELLGGIPLDGLCAYVEDYLTFELNKNYIAIMENATENLYRAVSKKMITLPTSNGVIKNKVIKEAMSLTPKETEQLSKYVANEDYVQTQKKDIEELSLMFSDLIVAADNGGDNYYTQALEKHYKYSDSPIAISIFVTNKNKNIYVKADGNNCKASMENVSDCDISIKLSQDTFDDIVNGRKSFQRGFMSGEITYKGELAKLRKLDNIFEF